MTTVDRDTIVAALDEVWDALFAFGDELTDEEWDLPTACPGWSVRDNMSHCLATEAMLLGRPTPEIELPDDLPHVRNDIGRINERWVASYRGRSGAEVMADYREIVGERRAALAAMDQAAFDADSWTPAGPDTYGRFMRIRVMDQWMHEQDMREAVGRPGDLAGVAVDASLDELTAALGFVLGKRAPAPPGSAVRFELTEPIVRRIDVEVTDRARVVEALDRDPDVTLTVPGDRFCRLTGGRVPTDEIAAGVRIDGDAALGRRILSSLAFMI